MQAQDKKPKKGPSRLILIGQAGMLEAKTEILQTHITKKKRWQSRGPMYPNISGKSKETPKRLSFLPHTKTIF